MIIDQVSQEAVRRRSALTVVAVWFQAAFADEFPEADAWVQSRYVNEASAPQPGSASGYRTTPVCARIWVTGQAACAVHSRPYRSTYGAPGDDKQRVVPK